MHCYALLELALQAVRILTVNVICDLNVHSRQHVPERLAPIDRG